MRQSPATIALAFIAVLPLQAATTINSGNPFSYGANIGWLDWRGDLSNGAVLGEFVCSGFIYAANVGWINLGGGSPANGFRYENNSAADFGVNHDGGGNLSGFAWAANIGWLNFTNRDAAGATFSGPRIDLRDGILSGFVWSANCGWIGLSNAIAFVETDSLPSGPDVDSDGIPDAWELQYTNTLGGFSAGSDGDSDGFTDVQEYFADTDPQDAASALRITAYSAGANGGASVITWTSEPSRLYRIQQRDNVGVAFPWTDAGLELISPSTAATTTRAFSQTPLPHRFFRIEAVRPLSP